MIFSAVSALVRARPRPILENCRAASQQIIVLFLITASLIGCTSAPIETVSTATPIPPTYPPPTHPPPTQTAVPQASATPEGLDFEFPDSIDPGKDYLFYLHGKILEDQGIPAVSPDYGRYDYEEILETFKGYGFVVISEQRSKNTDAVKYAGRVCDQVGALLEAGVPAENITVVGASKGGYIGIYVSHFLENEDINIVVMGICHPEEVENLKQGQVVLYGNVLAIYDASDEYAGSCQELFSFSEGKGISRYDEIVLDIGTGHGILYQPLEEWVLPAVLWATNDAQ